MASEIRVNKINSQTGVGTITLSPTGVDISGITTVSTLKVGTGLTASEDGDVFFTGVCTATTFTGSGANLTNLPAANLTGTLPAISGANLTGIAATDNVRTGILDVAGIATFRNDVNIGAAVTISESGIEASGIGITCANINGGAIGGRRNLIINGDFRIAQRSTSASTTDGYATVDRFRVNSAGTDEAPTQAQVDVTAGTTPYTEGFRKAYKITNGNQSGGAGTSDAIMLDYSIEAQDIANSGWNYTSSSSFVTLSFWVKSSVAQNFYGRLYSYDGTPQGYAFETGSLSADTWTKVTKTIPGNSNLTIDNNNAAGLLIEISAFRGTGGTASMTLNQWAAYNSNSRTPDQTSTWYTTNDATLEVTGLQLEVGPQATAFEHRSFDEELHLCERYCQVLVQGSQYFGTCMLYTSSVHTSAFLWKKTMRTTPTIVANSGGDYYITYRNSSSSTYDSLSGSISLGNQNGGGVYTTGGSGTQGHAGTMGGANANTLVYIEAEL